MPDAGVPSFSRFLQEGGVKCHRPGPRGLVPALTQGIRAHTRTWLRIGSPTLGSPGVLKLEARK